ncbi:ISNCY family transposase [Dickeya dianthicola]|uniref:ISNCY family transposase n=2 Tax=Dickeya dianthicola TaxID=204039 RepID=A0ABX9NUA6_9GAMM|nr:MULTISPECIES: ISNCY family transposase [Pectobacteriaceae]MBQ4793750.1 ISNCY family transposase [Pectobacterium versatile]MCI4205314.1 ISNCY family transposase [Dickeya dianthicola]MCI4214104.1 ISNCY family transposase [Dickeya dianthicola]MCL6397547.1 ISNCY family transposase [Pectobacterium carotovorum subsp. carotovorum]MZG32641.1 ISNCY family transposase [Dickeya dianthicola]
MSAESSGLFTLKEINRIRILQDVIDRRTTSGRAAQLLGVTPRHCSRLLKRYREHGPLGINNRGRGNPGNRLLPKTFTDQALEIIKEKYSDFGPTLAREKLEEIHGLILGKETVRRLMIKTGLWVPRKMRAPKIQQPRYRRACVGELIQIDGCDHYWFENRASPCTLLVYVDDATSRLMYLRFVQSESTFSYFEATRGYIERHGKPMSFYSDKASVFRVNNKNATTGDGFTQFGRAMHELNIQTICAETSSAKGRVERAHLTLQDRLVKELRLQNINNIKDANAYIESFIEDYNHRFSKPPRHDFNANRPLEPNDNLDLIFTWRELRKVSKNLTLQYDKILYLIEDSEQSRKAIGKYVEVYHFPNDHKEIWLNGSPLPYVTYDRLSVVDQGQIVSNKRLGHTLQIVQEVQKKRDNTRSRSVPSVDGPDFTRSRLAKKGKKSQRSLNQNDMLEALIKLQTESDVIFGKK